MASTTGERIYRARKTVLQMLRDRGYMVDETDVEQGEEDFFEKYTTSPQRDMLTLLVQVRVRSESSCARAGLLLFYSIASRAARARSSSSHFPLVSLSYLRRSVTILRSRS